MLLSQILAIAIALFMFVHIIWGKHSRAIIALSSGGAMILVLLVLVGGFPSIWEAKRSFPEKRDWKQRPGMPGTHFCVVSPEKLPRPIPPMTMRKRC